MVLGLSDDFKPSETIHGICCIQHWQFLSDRSGLIEVMCSTERIKEMERGRSTTNRAG
jgi:hypothetical protein